jgi:hypothetical protein
MRRRRTPFAAKRAAVNLRIGAGIARPAADRGASQSAKIAFLRFGFSGAARRRSTFVEWVRLLFRPLFAAPLFALTSSAALF